jgi:hypothetical protein
VLDFPGPTVGLSRGAAAISRYILDSRELYNESEKNTGRRFFVSVQDMCRF